MIRTNHLKWVAVSALVVAAAATIPRAQQATLSPEAIAEIDAFIQREKETAKVPGLSLAIAFKHQLIYSKGFGIADLEHRVPVTTQTAFRTASMAKPMTATAVMQLVEHNKIDLDAPVQKYCPAFPAKPWPVTVRHVLGHQAGIRHYKPGESAGKEHHFTIEDSLKFFKNDPLVHEPGTKYLYSTFAYSVLGCAIEGASGTTYEQYMRTNVWDVAGMSRTGLDRVWDIVPDRARGYYLVTENDLKTLPPAARSIARAGQIINAPLHDTSMKVPGGGLLSTPEDLVRFGVAFQIGKLVKKETLEAMWTRGRLRSGESTSYGLGWDVQPSQEGLRRISHGGNQPGGSGGLIIIPEVALTYVVMTNLEDVAIPTFTRGVAQILRRHLMK